MDSIAGNFRGVDLPRLKALKEAYIRAIEVVASGRTVVLNGRQRTSEDLPNLTAVLGEISREVDRKQAIADGATPSTAAVSYPDFRGGSW